jgi:hypothetical protein
MVFLDVFSMVSYLMIGMLVVLFTSIFIPPSTFLISFFSANLPALIGISSTSPALLESPPFRIFTGDVVTLVPYQSKLPSLAFFPLPTVTLTHTKPYTPTITNAPTKTKTINLTETSIPDNTLLTPTIE